MVEPVRKAVFPVAGHWFAQADPKILAKVLKRLAFAVIAGLAVYLALTGRLGWALFGREPTKGRTYGRGALSRCLLPKVQQTAEQRLVENSLGELLTRDLPPFDYVALDGIYSWVDGGRTSSSSTPG